MPKIKINRWAYCITVAIISIATGIALESSSPVLKIAFGLLLLAFTFPLGIVGALCAIPLIYTGIAIPSEAYFVAAPIFAIAGMVQWYVLFPRIFKGRNKSSPKAATKSITSLRYEFQIPDPTKPISGDLSPCGSEYELMDFKPQAVSAEMVVGRTVDEICLYVGTYGMGGPGFFGLRLGTEWLVVAIWGAASWILVDGRIVEDGFWEDNGWPRP